MISLVMRHLKGGGAGGAGRIRRFDFSGADFSDIFGDIFGDFFGGGRRSGRTSNGPMKGMNIRKGVRITFEEAVFGCEKEIEIVLKDPCEKCQGTGAKREPVRRRVRDVAAEARLSTPHSLSLERCRMYRHVRTVMAPARLFVKSVRTAQEPVISQARKPFRYQFRPESTMDRVSEYGTKVSRVPMEDQEEICLWKYTVSRHPIFQRQDMNIFSTAPISFAQAALGGDVRIKTVDGEVIYTVKPGTKTDTKVRLKGKGVPSVRNPKVRGDQYVTLVIQTPEKLSPEAKEALKRFDALSGNSLNQPEPEKKKPEKPKKKGFMDKLKETFEERDD